MTSRPRVAVLVDLPRRAGAGGHVKYWENLAKACAEQDAPIDLTVYFSGEESREILSPHVKLRCLPPVFSTARLKFLPYVPAHTDLAPYHSRLAQELSSYEVIHTTDGFFAFAKTAERVARQHKIPLVTSFHTDTPAYAELFTRQTLTHLLGSRLGAWADTVFKISSRQRQSKESRLKNHIRACSAVLALRTEDQALSREILGADKIKPMRLGVDKRLFAQRAEARTALQAEYGIPADRFIFLFVGRIDAGKNMPLLLDACLEALQKGANLHLVVAGLGPLAAEVKDRLGDRATLAGMLAYEKLAPVYSGVDALCMASDIEIGGLVGVEALASGCPVLVSEKSGIAALYNGTAAMQPVPSNPSSWAKAMASLSQDLLQQASMRAAALSFRQNNLADWHDVLKEDFIPVWQSVVSRKEA